MNAIRTTATGQHSNHYLTIKVALEDINALDVRTKMVSRMDLLEKNLLR